MAAIETIEVGDYVWAWDENTKDVALKQVVETYVNAPISKTANVLYRYV